MKRREMLVSTGAAVLGLSAFPFRGVAEAADVPSRPGAFRAGAHAQDITPDWFPVVVNGGFQPRYAEKALDPLHARCLVLDDGAGQLAIVVVDSCVMDRAVIDEAKEKAHKLTGIPTGRMFVSATHTHSAPAVVGVLGTDPDERYRAWLPGQIAEGIRKAQENLTPAQVGWSVESLPELVHSRRWIARPDRIKTDPFGEETTRATMHPGYRNPDWQEPSGPMNPEVSILAVRRPDGMPIALLGSFSIHYVGSGALSADYFGAFATRIGELLEAGGSDPPFVGILANGVSGDAYLRDYTRAEPVKFDMHSIAEEVAQAALKAYQAIAWKDWLSIDAREAELELNIREPKVDWAKGVMAEIEAEGRPLKSLTDFYAREQLLLAEMPPTRKLKLQVMRIGPLGMVGIPCEVFAITGMRIARNSPLAHTFTVMLANGWEGGYLPPPEQMVMGGYTTWLARSSCLEIEAEPKIIARVKELIADVAGDLRVMRAPPPIPAYAAAVMVSEPAVYWRLNDLNGPHAGNAVDGRDLGAFETQIAYYMPGPQSPDFPGLGIDNRAPHFVGQRLAAEVPGLGESYTVEMWFYNCMPTDARPVTGYLFSRGASGDHLAIGGVECSPGKLVFHAGEDVGKAHAGTTDVPLRNWVPRESWHHVVLVRDGAKATLYLDGRPEPELTVETARPPAGGAVWIGGRADGQFGFEGRIDEVAIYSRALPADEIGKHYQAAF
ncbi:MAG: LamG-like jellyroll fold domain-containing protein [Thermoguttaceae bacterium]|jgi:hypothetical protein|nr:LamG-like jellyroll fold domain-containing protein [Thermoguttaceae bacterium]